MKSSYLKNQILPSLIACLCVIAGTLHAVGTWTPLIRQAPGPIGLMMLLPDGTVMASNADVSNAWYRLTPDAQGSYVNGTWTTLASARHSRLYFASQILMDGRVFVAGGEYGTGINDGETYNPLTNTWTSAPAPGHRFSDACSEILPDGRVLIALVEGNLRGTIIYNPVSNTWSPGPSALGIHNESAWLKLPDDSVLTVDRDASTSERYIPSLGSWLKDADVPVFLWDAVSEVGGAVYLPNGKALFLGGTGHTAIYTPSGTGARGSWVAGPDVPDAKGTPDAPMAILVNGKVLCAVSPLGTLADPFPSPTTFYEYDYVTNSFTPAPSPTGVPLNHGSYYGTMLNLPDGTMLYSDFDNQVYSYKPDGTPLAAGKPTVTSIEQNPDASYHLEGILLNGISQGSSYGDDNQNATNYPIVRLTTASNSNVYYARTHHWSSTGVATGNTPLSTEFTVPANVPLGDYDLVVVANGISSDSIPFTHGPPQFTVSSSSDFFAIGAIGGPVSPASTSYTVANSGTSPVTWSAAGTQSWLTVSPSGGTLAAGTSVAVSLTFNNDANALSQGRYEDTVTFTNVTKGRSTTRLVYLRVKFINQAPSANAQTVSTDEDTEVDILLSGTDPNDDSLTYKVVTKPAHGTLSGPAPFLTYTPSLNYHGPDSFTFISRDGQLQSSEATVTINVASVIDLLVANDDVIAPGVAADVMDNDTDPDGTGPLTIESATNGSHGTVSVSVDKTTLTYTPGPNFIDSDTFTYTVKNGDNVSATANVSVRISQPTTHGVVMKNGEISGEPTGTVLQLIGQPSITADGRTAFSATYRSPDNTLHNGILFGEVPTVLVHDGSPAQGTTLNFSKFADPIVSSVGDIAFKASLLDAPKGAGEGIWAHDGTAMRLVARQQVGEAPGIAGAFFSKFQDIALPDDGRVIFTASLALGKGGVSAVNDFTLWREDGAGSIALLLREGEQIEVDHLQKTIKTIAVFGPGSPGTLDQRRGFNNSGVALARVSFTDRSAALIRIKNDGGLETILRTGIRYTGLGANIVSFGLPTYSDDGSISVQAKLDLPASRDSVIISRSGKGQLSIVAQESALVPNLGGAAYGSFSDPAGGNSRRLAFISKLKPRLGGVTPASDTILWRINPSGDLQLLARKSLPAPDTGGATFNSFNAFAWTGTANDGVAFVATLKPKRGLVTAANDTGLWAEGSDGTLYLALRKGATVQIGDASKTIKSFTMLGAVLGSIGQGHSSNFAGGYAALATFTDNTKGVITVWVP